MTTAPLTKLLPFTVSVNAAPPTIVLAGDRLVSTGMGLLTVKSTARDVPPPGAGLKTLIEKAPVEWISAAVICAAS